MFLLIPYCTFYHDFWWPWGGSLTMTSQIGLHWQIDLTPSPVMVVFLFIRQSDDLIIYIYISDIYDIYDIYIWYIYIWYIWYILFLHMIYMGVIYIYIWYIIYIYIHIIYIYIIWYISYIYIYIYIYMFWILWLWCLWCRFARGHQMMRFFSDHGHRLESLFGPNPLVHQVVLLKLLFFSGIQTCSETEPLLMSTQKQTVLAASLRSSLDTWSSIVTVFVRIWLFP